MLSCLRLRPSLVVLALSLGATTRLSAQGATARSRRAAAVPTPAAVLGFEPGEDRKLPSWAKVVEYFTRLDASTPRVSLHTLGRTTLGRPFIAAFIGDSATIANLSRYREIQRLLADPRVRKGGAAERARLLADGKTVVLITSSIHSTEVGGILTPLNLAHRLATAEDEETRDIRANVLTILVPSLNPDGVDIVGDWYRSTLGTPAEGTSPPELYHHYVGHDNNRDWYAFTQVETQLTVDSLHNVWHPQIVNDIHQQGWDASRIFIPPYMDPIEPNVDPILTAGVNAMGMAMAWRMTADGRTGIATNASYDAWTPARAYQHYHGGIRILTETASASLATPRDIPFDSLRISRGYDPRTTTWNFTTLWPGGHWTLRDIIGYQFDASWALLAEAARDRATWLTSFATVAERATAGRGAPGRGDWPVAFVIPMQQGDKAALQSLLRILQRGQVEVRQALAPFASGNVRFSRGTYVVLTAQPYGAFAKALLEEQKYPDLREYPGGPPKRPYDVTAHTLPLLMGIGVKAITDSFPVPVSEPIAPIAAPRLVAEGLSDSTRVRIGIYRSYFPSMDEGWTRWVFDQHRIRYTTIADADVRAGNLNQRFDAILLPDQPPRGLERGAPFAGYPDSLRGGLGTAGAEALKQFVSAGGRLIAFNEASDYAIAALGLPVKDVLSGVQSRDFYAPGSLLDVLVDLQHPIARRMTAHSAVWFEEGPAFEVTDPSRARVIARYPTDENPLASGWLLGGEKLQGRAALVEVTQGQGTVVLFGFRPQYRGQAMATYPLIWGALLGR